MKTLIKDYGLRFYVRDMYVKNAAKRGGEAFHPLYKKDLKPFRLRVKYAIDFAKKVIEKTGERLAGFGSPVSFENITLISKE